MADGSWKATFHLTADGWKLGPIPNKELRKQHGLQGPIDDAFMDSFVFVLPTGKSGNEKIGKWVNRELAHAREEWRDMFRGEAPVIKATDLKDPDIRDKNLILWGDPSSNPVMKNIVDRLPLQWNGKTLVMNGKTYDARHHVPVLIYPNPLNPKKYVVLNSGFTFREGHYLTNSNMIPKLPDWVIFDVDQPATPKRAVGITAADFFDETWQVKAKR